MREESEPTSSSEGMDLPIPRKGAQARHKVERTKTGFPRIFVDVLGWVILVAWIVSFTLNLFRDDYQPEPAVHGLMMIVVSAAFVTNVMRRDDNGNGK